MQTEDTTRPTRLDNERRDLVQVGVCAYFKCEPAPMSRPLLEHRPDPQPE